MKASEMVKAGGFKSLKEFSEYSGICDRKLALLHKKQIDIFTSLVKTYSAQRLCDLIG